jgi:integrase
VNPCTHLRLPAVRGRRERIASAEETEQLLAALAEPDRAVWATALYAGLRRGELIALRWEEVDVAPGVSHLERAHDDKDRVEVEPKNRAGRRAVPIVPALGDVLVERKMGEKRETGLVFGSNAATPLQPSNASRPEADRPPRGGAHLRVAPDSRGRERKVDHDLHGSRLDTDDL